jgi:capsular exopolysaccharide synthesis family protein
VVNEGKTFVAGNLAVTLAKCFEFRTLLIEGDLHRPALASLFGFGELRGMTHWWAQESEEIDTFLHRVNDMPLWMLTAGQIHDQPSDILQSSRFTEAFAQLSRRFDWVIVDSTPMQPIIDANLWSRLVDRTLLVVREGVAPVKALTRGLQSLDSLKLVGIVINEASECDHSSYGGMYYSSKK